MKPSNAPWIDSATLDEFRAGALASGYDEAIERVWAPNTVLETLMPEDSVATVEPDPEQVAHNAAREDLAKLLSPEEERETRAEYLLRGAPSGAGDAIVRCAQELAVELVVMGKHRQGFVDHLVAGSVAEKVIRRAPCPVLIVHHPEHDFVQDER